MMLEQRLDGPDAEVEQFQANAGGGLKNENRQGA